MSLDPAEAALLVFACGHLCFLPWALGAMHFWSQATSLILAIIGCGFALWSRQRRGFAIGPLLRHPLFWTGLAWLAYIAVQAANPAWRYLSDAERWWLEPIPHLGWLPAGVEAPVARSNPWRMLVIHGSLLLLATSIWLGFSRRKSYRILLTVLGGNALLLALLGLVQRLDGAARIFWIYRASNERFVASFIYPNHAGPYFYLMTAVAAGLAWWCLRRPVKPWQGASLVMVAGLCSALVLQTQSRMSVLLLALFWVVFAVAAGWHAFCRKAATSAPARRAALSAAGLALVIVLPLSIAPGRQVWQRFTGAGTTETERKVVRQATAEMLGDRWLLGWGAGCFRHVFPLYAQHHPVIYEHASGWRKYWEHAHNDWLEIPAEFGALGTVPMAVFLGWIGLRLGRSRCWTNPVSLALTAGGALPPLHAGVDFVFQNPAVLFTWVLLLVTAIRWGELERAGQPASAGKA